MNLDEVVLVLPGDMGEVIRLERVFQREQPYSPLRVKELKLDATELDWLAQRAGEIAHRRPFTNGDFEALIRILTLDRAMKTLAAVSGTDADVAAVVALRRSEILAGLT